MDIDGMPQVTLTIHIDDEVGDISISIEEIQADGVTITRGQRLRR